MTGCLRGRCWEGVAVYLFTLLGRFGCVGPVSPFHIRNGHTTRLTLLYPPSQRHIVWWLAALGVVLTASRTLVSEDPVAYDPETALAEVAAVTHHMPRHWRGRAHTPEVRGELSQMFQLKVRVWGAQEASSYLHPPIPPPYYLSPLLSFYQVQLFLEEMASVLLTPYILHYVMPSSAADIIAFIANNTVKARMASLCDVLLLMIEPFNSHLVCFTYPGGGSWGRVFHVNI